MTTDLRRLDRLSALSATLAGAWGARARAATSIGQERAMLRLFGVHGLSRAGTPLAGEVIDCFIGRNPDRLAAGIGLCFAMALLEYDVTPQQLALDVAAGSIDLALEAELLREPDRRAVAESELARLIGVAMARIDANRTARRELLDVLGDPPRPWVGTSLVEAIVDGALLEALQRVSDGFDLLRVEVPVGRELAGYLVDAGVDVPVWQSLDGVSVHEEGGPGDHLAPTGSQRGLARLRRALDEVAAGRRGYVRLATAAPALAAPEQAVVAAFERVDVVEADAMAEIVAGSVDPDRAFADHAFAHRLLRRSGTALLLGPGPLVVAPDLARGLPSDAATRAGRALALQLVAVRLALGDGLPAGQVIVGALPMWLTDEPRPAARAAAGIALRRALLPEHSLAYDEPPGAGHGTAAWPFVLAGVASGQASAVVLRRSTAGAMHVAAQAGRAAVAVAAELGDAWTGRELSGEAAAYARATVEAAIRTLEALDGEGWRAVLGDPLHRRERPRFGGDVVVERVEPDPLVESAATAAP